MDEFTIVLFCLNTGILDIVVLILGLAGALNLESILLTKGLVDLMVGVARVNSYCMFALIDSSISWMFADIFGFPKVLADLSGSYCQFICLTNI